MSKKEQEESKSLEDETCIWDMETPCEGELDWRLFFNKTMKVPVCEKHTVDHKEVMFLLANDYPVQEIVEWDEERRKREVYIMVMSGIDFKDFTY